MADHSSELQRDASEKRFQWALGQLREGCPYFALYRCPDGDEKLRRACAVGRDLTAVNLEFTDVSDLGLRSVASLPKLRVLVLSEANVADQGIQHIANMQTIQTLVLDRTKVTAKGLLGLQTLSGLRYLLYDVDVPDPKDRPAVDATVAALKELRGLTTLEVGGNWVSGDTVRDLQAALPAGSVRWLKDRDDRWFYQGGFVPPDAMGKEKRGKEDGIAPRGSRNGSRDGDAASFVE